MIDRFLDAHLNMQWLRPESALCESVVSSLGANLAFNNPSLDLGCGNGHFSFVTAGGAFTEDYDWYRNARPGNGDMYDVAVTAPRAEWVARRPGYGIDVGFDAKESLLAQAAAVEFYGRVEHGDANRVLPFADESFATVFSNILSWLERAAHALAEIHRVLRPGGRAILCLQTERFIEYCAGYSWREEGSKLLELLNGGRADTLQWSLPWTELQALAVRAGFTVVERREYWEVIVDREQNIDIDEPFNPWLAQQVLRRRKTPASTAR